MDQPDQIVGESMSRKLKREIVFDILPSEKTETNLSTSTTSLEIELDGHERMLGQQHLLDSIRDHNQRPHRIKLCAQVVQEVDRRDISPVHVIQEHDHGINPGYLLKKSRQFPFDALLRRRYRRLIETG